MSDTSDAQDGLIADAGAYGGPEFVDKVTFETTAVADAVATWDGTGDEPAQATECMARHCLTDDR